MHTDLRNTTAYYNYELPEEAIAKFPVSPRDQSKLLVYREGGLQSDQFFNLASYLEADDCLVVNNTKVIPARLHFFKDTGAKIEVLCLSPIPGQGYEEALQSTGSVQWSCIVGNLKKWKQGAVTLSFSFENKDYTLSAVLDETSDITHIVSFEWDAPCTFYQVLEASGSTPLPPYLNRDASIDDRTNYQTFYSRYEGSVAAPTAGLHFTQNALDSIVERGISIQQVTLHVGAGTFAPVKSEFIKDHPMHREYFEVDRHTLEKLSDSRKNIVAVGTTSLRTLESLYWLGAKLIINRDFTPQRLLNLDQFEADGIPNHIEYEKAFDALLAYLHLNNLDRISAQTRLMITPGYRFNVVKKLITNFHQPQSTLLMLISAFVGEDWRKIYQYALENGFRFLSYGDSSILIPEL